MGKKKEECSILGIVGLLTNKVPDMSKLPRGGKPAMTTFEITAPDDLHLHVRDGNMLKAVLPHTTRIFRRAIIMPNLVPPVSTLDMAKEYRGRILAAVPPGDDFEPLMTLYLTHNTTPDDIRAAAAEGTVKAVKWYPAGTVISHD